MLLEQLRAATEELTYPSESDAGVCVEVIGQDPPWLKAKRVGLAVEVRPPTEFFQPLRKTDDAARWHTLETLVMGGLDEPKYYRVGEVRVRIFVAGKDRESGELVAITTESVET